MSKSKNIGTSQGETPLVKWLHENGFPKAERRALHGATDKGDILVDNGFIIEVKVRGGKSSNAGLGQPGPGELTAWLEETRAECRNTGAEGFLVVKRKGTTDPGQWWAYCDLEALRIWGFPTMLKAGPNPWVCLTVADAVQLHKKVG